MTNAVSCACGWHARGTEEELIDAMARHKEEAHSEKTSGEPVASELDEGCGC